MDDKELLKLAAKAAGDVVYIDDMDAWIEEDSNGNRGAWWRPLTDDGDALRLAVKLDMVVMVNRVDGSTSCEYGYFNPKYIDEHHGEDHYAATRRAIVRAAAEIGRTL